ncbi:MAG: 3-phosphoserine/phosphohydroxythreonine transaminase [Gammaproteobacteria bacterium]|nr:3-phosphoserine/phosphohydroxythreonine transaminase [Gammaproteobacteria bacterium]
MKRAYNFSAGPAMLPNEVMERARDEFLDFRDTGMSVMEISHRSKEFIAVAEQAEADLRELLAIPDNYKVLFLQGGASLQYSMSALNLLKGGKKADFFRTGAWSDKAIKEVAHLCEVNIVADGKASSYTDIPAREDWKFSDDAAFVHFCPNETIHGVEFQQPPETPVGKDGKRKPLVADMSSCILSRPIDVSKYDVIYAGAQKNIGPSGLTVVIVRDDHLDNLPDNLPRMLSYRAHADGDSMFNTPPTYPWYLAGLVFDWLKQQGGVEAIEKVNIRKAEKLYAAIDASDFYTNPVAPAVRSRMNLPFTLKDPELDAVFLKEAEQAGLTSLKGHRSVGGMRASIYNAMPEAGVDALIAFMQEFEKSHG